ncbi:prepilin-type N-terminal cleavage/methylation domain-containing protein [Pseudomonadota bacterium]
MQIKNNQNGFTLIEMAMVLLLISIIIGAIASSQGIVKRANLAAARQMTANSPVVYIDGLVLWLETSLNDSVEADSSNIVTRWNDISGNGRNLSPGTGPDDIYEGNILEGVPVVKFNGTESVSYSDPIASERHTTFVVARVDEDASSQSLFYNGDSASNGWGIVRKGGSTGNIAFADHDSEIDIQQYDNRGGVFVIKYDGTDGYGKVNDGSWSSALTGIAITFPDSGTITVGGGVSMVNTEIAEVIIYDRDLFDSEVNDVVEYLMKKYDLN